MEPFGSSYPSECPEDHQLDGLDPKATRYPSSSAKRSKRASIYFRRRKHAAIGVAFHQDLIPDYAADGTMKYRKPIFIDVTVTFYGDTVNFPYSVVGEVHKEEILIVIGEAKYYIKEFQVEGYEFVEEDIARFYFRCKEISYAPTSST